MGSKSREKEDGNQEKLIVFICTANVCRSPMAEKLFEQALSKASNKQKIRILSAGISAMEGDRASENSVEACKEVGLDLTAHRSSAITRATLENASAIFCMTESHRALLHMYFELPENAPVFMMREFIEDGTKELPDPYGQSMEVYRTCREDMIEALPSLITWVEKNL
ncbi:MAG: protein tyrosine phosphatase [Opitutae bacterium]|nr:protein tyrosine phosphatase [Opitutae bacterium]|tara:strand:+ start:5157 stop:5660 length:504 start_codon:yes stop_codon:yes gene_type:complete